MLKFNSFIVSILKRLGIILSALKYNGTGVWPVSHQSTFTFNLPSNNRTVDIWLTQSSPYAVTVRMDDGTTMTSAQLQAEFTHQFSNSGTHTVIVEVAEGEIWYPGVNYSSSSSEDDRTFVGTRLPYPDTDNTLKTIVFGYGARLGDTTWGGDGMSSFTRCAGLTSVDFSASDMTVITSMVFYECESLTTVNWGNIREVGFEAFCYCGFTELHLPSTLEKLEFRSFDALESLERLEVGAKHLAPSAIAWGEHLQYIWVRNSCLELQAGKSNTGGLFSSEVQWLSCNPNASFCCEPQTKPVAWGNQFNAYQKNGNTYLRYEVHWNQTIAPWIAPPEENIPTGLTYSYQDGILLFYEVDSRCGTCGGDGIQTIEETCPVCDGAGREYWDASCPECGGSGEVDEEVSCNTCEGSGIIEEYDPGSGEMIQMTCPSCDGAGTILETHSCSECDGTGTIEDSAECEECGGSGIIANNFECHDCDGSGISHDQVLYEEYSFNEYNNELAIYNSGNGSQEEEYI